jgi:predicted GH43/DUF377 family glycosyl hydrolase
LVDLLAVSNATFELKDRVSCPPGGFVYTKRDGQKSTMMPYLSGAVELARAEHKLSQDDAVQMVLGTTYLNMPLHAREHFISKSTEGLIYQNRSFRYVDSNALSDGAYKYNAGLIEHDGADHLVYRLQQLNGDSTIHRFNFTTHANEEIKIPAIYPQEQFEDPRVFMHDGAIHLIFSSWRKDWKYVPILRLIKLTEDWKFGEEIPLTFGGNGKGKIQKNWQGFSHDGAIHFLYWYDPWQVICGDRVYTGKPLRWDYGEIRGGTPPVKVGDFYYSFTHSRLDVGRARYHIGAVKFEAEAPFRPVAMTMLPLMTSTNKEPNLHWAPTTVFPCGCIFRDGKFIVSMGVNDLACGLADWTFEELSALLRPV